MLFLIGLVVTIITIVLQVLNIPEYLWDVYPFLVWFPLVLISVIFLLGVIGPEIFDDVIDIVD